MVQVTHQFKFFTLRFVSRKKVKKKFVLTKFFFFVTSIQFVACELRENLSNRSSGVQIPHDICTRFGRYLYSGKCSWIIKPIILFDFSPVTGEKTFWRTPIRGLKITVLISSYVTRRALLNLYSSYAPTTNWFCSSFFVQILSTERTLHISELDFFCFLSIIR